MAEPLVRIQNLTEHFPASDGLPVVHHIARRVAVMYLGKVAKIRAYARGCDLSPFPRLGGVFRRSRGSMESRAGISTAGAL